MNHLPEKMRPYRELLEKSAKEYVKLAILLRVSCSSTFLFMMTSMD